jgi:hypothetical protein
MTNEHVGRGQRRAVHRSLQQEQSPRARCGSDAAWGCRTSCRTPSQSFEPGAGRNARQTLLREAIEAPRPSRSPRRNAQFRLLSGSVSNGSSGRGRMVPRPQMRPRRICSSPEMSPSLVSSPGTCPRTTFGFLRIASGNHLRPVTRVQRDHRGTSLIRPLITLSQMSRLFPKRKSAGDPLLVDEIGRRIKRTKPPAPVPARYKWVSQWMIAEGAALQRLVGETRQVENRRPVCRQGRD